MKNDKRYALNLDKFFELVTKKNSNEKNTDSTITEIWQPDQNNELKIDHKEIVDNKYDANNHLCGVRYDFLSNSLNQILHVFQTADGSTFLHESQMTFGQRIIFETFLKEGVIYEIKNNKTKE